MKFVTVDTEADAVYVRIKKGLGKKGESKTQKHLYKGEVDIILDFDKNGKLIGVEII